MHIYRELSPESIIGTLERLKQRIGERFPDRGLYEVCSELLEVSRQIAREAAELAKPNWWFRGALAVIIGVGVAGSVYLLHLILNIGRAPEDASSFVQGLDAFFNIVVLSGLAIVFLTSIELRLKRRHALRRLYELRSFSHVIDMHQLSKEPSVSVGLALARPTPSSPDRDLRPGDLIRYLDYCTEMLAIIGKLAALYAQNLRDPVTVAAVNEMENLTSDLSRKIWQKLIIIHRNVGAAGVAAEDLLTVLHRAEG